MELGVVARWYSLEKIVGCVRSRGKAAELEGDLGDTSSLRWGRLGYYNMI